MGKPAAFCTIGISPLMIKTKEEGVDVM